MKNLRIAVLTVLLTSTMVVVFARPVSKAKNFEEAKIEFYKDFKSNLIKWNAIDCLGQDCSAEFIVYCEIDEDGKVEVKRVIGQEQELKERVLKTMENHPVYTSEILKGETMNFKLRFEKQ